MNKAIDVVLQQLSEDYEDLQTRVKITLIDIQQLVELCVSVIFFEAMLFGIYWIQEQFVVQ